MSDQTPILFSFTVTGDWKCFVAYIHIAIPRKHPNTGLPSLPQYGTVVYQAIPAHGSPHRLNGYHAGVLTKSDDRKYSLGMGTIFFRGDGDKCHITIETTERFRGFWDVLALDVQQLAEHYANVQRTSLTQQFEHILDVYYEQKDQGMKIKLADLARRAGVNYASLRQAKVRYDRRKNTKNEAQEIYEAQILDGCEP